MLNISIFGGGGEGEVFFCVKVVLRRLLSKTAKTGVIKYFVTDRHFCVTNRHLVNLFKWTIFPLSQVEYTFCFALSMFLCTIIAIWSK